jgi:hypothetical protein
VTILPDESVKMLVTGKIGEVPVDDPGVMRPEMDFVE